MIDFSVIFKAVNLLFVNGPSRFCCDQTMIQVYYFLICKERVRQRKIKNMNLS